MRHSSLRLTLCLQPVIILYTLASVCSKLASSHLPSWNGSLLSFVWQCIVSPAFVGLLFLMVALLGAYAVIWQRVIRDGKIAVIYANKGTEIFWSQFLAAILFSEHIGIYNMTGIALIFTGIFLVNGDGETK